MTRKKISVNQARSALYKAARILGDIQAVSRGRPGKVAKRVARRQTGKATGRLLGRLFK